MPKVSIVFVNYNDWDYLEPCLASIYDREYPWPIEIIVTDNGSDNDESSKIRDAFSDVIVIEAGTNLGFAAGNNVAMKRGKGEYVLVLNCDTVFKDQGMIDAVAVMDRQNEIAMLGPELLNADGSHQSSTHLKNSLGNTFWKLFKASLYLDRILKSREQFDVTETQNVQVICGAAMLVRKTFVDSSGGFDERFFFTVEERDWCLRALKAGFRILYFPKWKIVHFGGEVRSNQLWYAVQRQCAMLEFFKKYRGALGYLALRIILLTYSVTRLLNYTLRQLVGLGNPTVEHELSVQLGVLKWQLGLTRTSDIHRTKRPIS